MNFVNQLVPIGMPWCIAGGFAACPALANDIDVWVYQQSDLSLARTRVLEHLGEMLALAPKYGKPFVLEAVTGSEQQQASERYQNMRVNIEKVAMVYGRNGFSKVKPVHLMVTDAPDPSVILSGFDVSTHAVAIDQNGRVHTQNFTHPGEKPQALLRNEKTPTRMKRIAERFGHTLTMEEIFGEG